MKQEGAQKNYRTSIKKDNHHNDEKKMFKSIIKDDYEKMKIIMMVVYQNYKLYMLHLVIFDGLCLTYDAVSYTNVVAVLVFRTILMYNTLI